MFVLGIEVYLRATTSENYYYLIWDCNNVLGVEGDYFIR